MKIGGEKKSTEIDINFGDNVVSLYSGNYKKTKVIYINQ
jgi:hypothetical protein